MSKIAERTNEILKMLREEFENTELYFDKCYDPLVYIRTSNPTAFPLILISYKGSVFSNGKPYPHICIYEIYFCDIKQEAETLFDFMQDVYNFFKNNVVQTIQNGEIVTGQKMIYNDQSFHAESNEHVIYVQKYNLLIP
jgi:hypothetical protein